MLNKSLALPDKIRIGEMLIQKGFITKEQLSEALLTQRNTQQKLGKVLRQQGLVTHHQLSHALLEHHRYNWAAAALFALYIIVEGASKVATASSPAVASPNTVFPSSIDKDAIKDRNPLTRQPTTSPWQKINNSLNMPSFRKSLTDNPHPTVASPLIGFCNPLGRLGYLSQGIRGPTHQDRMEYAYDLGIGIGSPVYAMRAGRVIGTQDRYPDTGGGVENISRFNYVLILHDGGFRSAYVHLQRGFRGRVQIKSGDIVAMGQLIGFSGNSGWSTGPHLHIEVQEPGSAFSFSKSVPFSITGACELSD